MILTDHGSDKQKNVITEDKLMQIKEGLGWKAWNDEENGRCFGEYGGGMSYHLYELTKDQFGQLDASMTEGDASLIMYEGRHLYMSVNDRCGPPYTVVFDDDYKTLCPWANVVSAGKVWPDALTDAAVELFASEENNRAGRRKKREARKKRTVQPTEIEVVKMFREMRRIKQQIPQEECRQVLMQQPRGVLSMLGDDGYPYGIPMDHWYCEADGAIYFHCAKAGHKIDAITACDKVSYCVMDEGWRKDGEWALNIRSVVIFGRICFVDDEDKKREICTNLVKKFTDDEEYLRKELSEAFPRVQCLKLKIEHMTGKLVNES